MTSDSILALRKRVSDLEKRIETVRDIQRAYELLAEDMLLELTALLNDARNNLAIVEQEYGCNICGAQPGEDCREFNWNGACADWENYKETEGL